MPGYLEDPTQWRLRTPGGVAYKILHRSGSFSRTEGTDTRELLIPSIALVNFAEELFPSIRIVGSKLAVTENLFLTNAPLLRASKLTWSEFIEGKPVDPFLEDPLAPAGTYATVVKCSIEFDAKARLDWELSGQASGKYIHAPNSAGSVWLPQAAVTNNPDQPGAEKVKEGLIPTTVVAPETEWTAKWPLMPEAYFADHYIPVLRSRLGKINTGALTPTAGISLYEAAAETILFTGWTYRETYNWRIEAGTTPTSSSVDRMVEVELKFQEKRIEETVSGETVIYGHNHFWRPNKGWRKLVKSSGEGVHQTTNLNDLFDILA